MRNFQLQHKGSPMYQESVRIANRIGQNNARITPTPMNVSTAASNREDISKWRPNPSLFAPISSAQAVSPYTPQVIEAAKNMDWRPSIQKLREIKEAGPDGIMTAKALSKGEKLFKFSKPFLKYMKPTPFSIAAGYIYPSIKKISYNNRMNSVISNYDNIVHNMSMLPTSNEMNRRLTLTTGENKAATDVLLNDAIVKARQAGRIGTDQYGSMLRPAR